MKKFLAVLMTGAMLVSFASCAKDDAETTEAGESVAVVTKDEGVMTYAEYAAAAIDSEVVIEAYVQAKQSWWDNQATVYLQDQEGGYFAYNMTCSEADYDLLVPGQYIKVTGYKSEWAGEVEIVDATFEIVDGNYIAQPVDVTDLLGTDAIVAMQNQLVSFTGMTVESIAFKNDEPGDDIYLTLSYNGNNYDFCLEYYLNGSDADFYNTVSNLQPGQTVNVEGFLYWYEGMNPHITSVTVV